MTEGPQQKIRIVVVDDHPVVRQGLVAMLGYENDLLVVGEAADGQEGVRVILEQKPDVVLLDLRLPILSGIEVMKQVRPREPQCKFLVLTTYDTDEYIVPALSAGAQGYLLKDASPDELVRAIHLVQGGGSPLEPGIAAKLLGSMSESKTEELSPREREVLQLLVVGASNKAIASQIHLSENTVKSHISHIFGKLNVQSRAEAVAVALKRGLASLENHT